jgi:hypothetical protein
MEIISKYLKNIVALEILNPEDINKIENLKKLSTLDKIRYLCINNFSFL